MIYKKIIIPIMFLILLSFVVADNPPYNNYHWGDTNFAGKGTLRSLGANENTYCQPFIAQTTGTITKFYMHGTNPSGRIYWCLSSFVQNPVSGCFGGDPSGNMVNSWFPTTGQNVNYDVVKGQTYYSCVQVDQFAGTGNLLVGDYDYYTIDDSSGYIGITTPSSSDQIETYQPNPQLFFSQSDGNGSYTGFSAINYTVRAFQYCMDNSTTDCHIFSSNFADSLTGEQLNDMVGEVFQFNPDSSSLVNVTLMTGFHLTGCPTCRYRVEVFEWDEVTNTTGVSLYNSSNIASSGATLSSYGFEKQTHTLESVVNLVNDDYYLVGARCMVGCTSSLSERLHLLNSNHLSTTDFFIQGFDDENSYRYSDVWSGLHTDVNYDTWFLLGLDNPVWIEEEEQDPSNLTNCSTNCTTWDGSSYLKEDFNGDISTCDWAVNDYYCWDNQIITDKTYDYYSIFKNTDLKYDIDSRYFTVSFDIRLADIEQDGYVSVSLYDHDFVKYVNVLFGDNNILYNNENGDLVSRYTNMSTTSSKTVQLHIDLTDDDFDLYYDNSLVASSLQFVDVFYNMVNIYGIRISSQDAGYILDDLEVYATNQNNIRTFVDGDLPSFDVDEDESFCGYFTQNKPTCTQDSDCETGLCLPTGRCASFDFTYCDEKGKKRGNMCMVSAMTSCVLNSTGELILSNFFLFLIFVVLMMGLVYLTIMLRS